jgi:hypothetical protein
MIKRILIRRDATANWHAANPVLGSGELGIEICADGRRKLKVGDGYTSWIEAGYLIDDEQYDEALAANEAAIGELYDLIEARVQADAEQGERLTDLAQILEEQAEAIAQIEETDRVQDERLEAVETQNGEQEGRLTTLGERVTTLETTPVSAAILEAIEQKTRSKMTA